MAIALVCSACRSTLKVGTKKCSKCGKVFDPSKRKYRVRVRVGSTWKTKCVGSLDLARKVEAQFKAGAVKTTELGILEAPVIDEVYAKLADHCTLHCKGNCYERFWRVHIQPQFGGRKLDTIRTIELDAFHLKLKQHRHKLSPNAKSSKTKPLALSTVAAILKTIRRLYSVAQQKGMYDGPDPTRHMGLPKFDNRLTNVLSKEQLKNLLLVLQEWPTRGVALGLHMALVTGKRTGEVFGLTWSRVNFEAGVVAYVTKSRVHRKTQVLPMNDLTRSILQEAKQHRMPGVDLVFHTATGKAIHYYSPWKKIKKAAGLPKEFRPHDLRHTFASYLASSGEVDIYTLQNLLGHETIAMTQRYSHLMDGRLREAVSVADRVLSNYG